MKVLKFSIILWIIIKEKQIVFSIYFIVYIHIILLSKVSIYISIHFQKSLNIGAKPYDWKTGYVVPIYIKPVLNTTLINTDLFH